MRSALIPLESQGGSTHVPDATAHDVFLCDWLPRPFSPRLHRLLQILSRSYGDAVDFSHARPDGGASGGSFHRSQDGFAPIRPSEERGVRTRYGLDACDARYHDIRPADDYWSF